jgi:hypothetical protein
MSEKTEKGLIAIFALALLFPVALLRGVVLKDLWSWFIVPLGVKQIGMAEALGLSLILGYCTYTYVDNDEEHAALAMVVRATIITLSAWGFGALYAHFR